MICHVPQIAPATFYAYLAAQSYPDLASDRAKKDVELRAEMTRASGDTQSAYAAFAIGTFANKIVG